MPGLRDEMMASDWDSDFLCICRAAWPSLVSKSLAALLCLARPEISECVSSRCLWMKYSQVLVQMQPFKMRFHLRDPVLRNSVQWAPQLCNGRDHQSVSSEMPQKGMGISCTFLALTVLNLIWVLCKHKQMFLMVTVDWLPKHIFFYICIREPWRPPCWH